MEAFLKYSDFISALPVEKKESDPVWARYVLRPASLPLAWLLMRAGLSGNTVSLVGIVLAIVAAFALAAPALAVALTGVLLFFLVSLGDCVDGNIARARGEMGPEGEFMDALGGYTVYAVLPLAVGFRAESTQGLEDVPGALMLVGSFVAVSNLYVRLVHQKYVNTARVSRVSTPSPEQPAKESLAKRISGELGLVGWMMPLLLIAVAFGFEWLYLAVYALFYGLVSFAVTAKTALQVYRAE